ncbi:hypothetical protein JCM19237_2020 [Photobacterium aphoticum]|uniref:Uncharacterized protein n=1 Tax=Photobacterium aphoticum TaxID=754436 RepID=A0A090QPW8_9GAMM|nr:hypothetical protein JCM19237_2020 [Photobacterium aphoticum]
MHPLCQCDFPSWRGVLIPQDPITGTVYLVRNVPVKYIGIRVTPY